jgi:uncharacterized protein
MIVPLISQSNYSPPLLFSNPHLQTIFPVLFRRVMGVDYWRQRISTPDGDFLDLDRSDIGSDRLGIILTGLEGDSSRAYVRGMAKALNRKGWDALVMNFRGCSGESNRKVRFYHSGDTGDLDSVISHVVQENRHREIVLIGFSLGGNVVLKYLGERATGTLALIKRAVAISVPCDLASSAVRIASPMNRLYMKRFLKMLHEKIRMKMAAIPGSFDDSGYDNIKNFKDYDDRYTAPMFGFDNAEDYWQKASSKPRLADIAIPTLVINAADDPFLAEPCYPVEEARANPNLCLEIPKFGGHVGFVTFNHGGQYWSESRAVAFLEE